MKSKSHKIAKTNSHWNFSKVKLKPSTAIKRKGAVTLVLASAAVLSQIPDTPAAHGQTIADAQAEAASIATALNALGLQISQLVQRYNQAESSLSRINQGIAGAQAQIAQSQAQVASTRKALTQEALHEYMTGSNLTQMYALFTNNPTQSTVRQEYLNTVTNSQSDRIAAYQSALQSLDIQQKTLKSLQAKAQSTVQQAAAAKDGAQTKIIQERAQLNSVNATIANLVAQRQAILAQQAAAQAAAAAARERAIASSSQPMNLPPVTPIAGGYGNPLRGLGGLSPERVDQGVDYGGFGPIYAIGNGVVISVTNGGWPGGTFIAYRLTSGPASGLTVYAAEDIRPQVRVGEYVGPNSVIGTMYAGFDGIETGWANPNQLGETMARSYGQFSGANSTAFGFNFSQFLRSLGAPGGVLQNNPPTGYLPSRWPTW